MATSVRFYPKGTVGTETAILWLARAKYPSRWTDDAMSEVEQRVWSGINRSFNGYVIGDELVYRTRDKRAPDTILRLADFEECLLELRRALHAGDLVAHFIDEHGAGDFVKPYSWGSDGAVTVLLTGVADLEDGYARLILINEKDLRRVFGRQVGQANSESLMPRPPSLFELSHWYTDRVAAFAGAMAIPSHTDDERDAKQAFPGVTRAMLRQCRAEIAPASWSKRGPRGSRSKT